MIETGKQWMRPSRHKSVRFLVAGLLLCINPVFAAEYSASFENADVSEFVNTVSAALNKTIILAPEVRGNITVRSYDTLNAEQYYQFFLSVLEVHGFAVVENNNITKVIPSKNAKTSAIKVGNEDNPGVGDEFITWVLPVSNVPVRELSPLLRQLNDNAGNVVHYDPSNILLLTGRSSNVQRMADIVRRVDQAGNRSFAVIALEHASAAEMERIITTLTREGDSKSSRQATVVADERSNRLIVSGDSRQIQQTTRLVNRLDAEQKSTGNTRVFYLRYARAEDIREVLEGVGQTVLAEKESSGSAARQNAQNFSINVHDQTNAVVVTAQPDMMSTLENVIKQLDIRRAQVLVEAIIVEVADGDGVNLSFQLANKNGSSLIQFSDGRTVPIGDIMYGLKEAETKPGNTIVDGDKTIENPEQPGDYSKLAEALSGISGAAFSVTSGDWTGLLQAVMSSSQSNVLSTPSLMTLDNEEASFIVGNEVPTLTGSTSSSNNDNPYQTVERREVGVKLNVKPQINEGDSVILDIVQEVSAINGQTNVDITFAKREVRTSVMARSGDTVVIGGLIDEDVQESESRVPILGSIPLIGRLFRSTSSSVSKRNLMVFIRPTIIREDGILNDISGKKYSLMRARQLDRREDGIRLMPDHQSPVLPEKLSNEDLLNKAREYLESSSSELPENIRQQKSDRAREMTQSEIKDEQSGENS